MWDFFSLPDPRNQDKKWDIFLDQPILPLNSVKLYSKSFKQGYEAY